MQLFDVLIVGGGPAGSSCARTLGAAGLKAAVIDAREFPRDKPCAGWITPRVLELLELTPDEYGRHGRVIQPITAFRTGLAGTPLVETRYGRVVSYGIRRLEFDDFLLRRSGAGLVLGERVERVWRDGERWVVNERFAAPMLVGAGGHFCPVARVLSKHTFRHETAVLAQEIELPANQAGIRQRHAADLFFCPELNGYGWVFPKGDYLNVGFGSIGHSTFHARLDAFRAVVRRHPELRPLANAKWHGHAYLLSGLSSREIIGDGALLVGDAAGLANPLSGEGILPAVESGLMAAETILGAEGVYERARLENYRRRIRRRYGVGWRSAAGGSRAVCC
ncbi:MAG: NAD(P)/FAD-dependent oxidoreductase [Acidobacteria bacterium]|nr:NAD(P)/FAD-dependent oxidoreductase [Acidobacteriota bacterium]